MFLLTQWQGDVFEDVAKGVTSIPACFHGGLTPHCGDQGLDGFLNRFAEPGIGYVSRLKEMKEVSEGADSIAFHLEKGQEVWKL